MAMQEASPASAPSAQVVGNAFVEQYYHILHHSPELVHRFYRDSSSLSRPDVNGTMTTVTSMQASLLVMSIHSIFALFILFCCFPCSERLDSAMFADEWIFYSL